ncbi:MAG: hypothetical protein HY774_12420 [Acidobacteria bacterium]|nr:hypothetical protein [Acidobacteriota bacterium]
MNKPGWQGKKRAPVENHLRLRESTIEETERNSAIREFKYSAKNAALSGNKKFTSKRMFRLAYTGSKVQPPDQPCKPAKRAQIKKPIQGRQFKNLSVDDLILGKPRARNFIPEILFFLTPINRLFIKGYTFFKEPAGRDTSLFFNF